MESRSIRWRDWRGVLPPGGMLRAALIGIVVAAIAFGLFCAANRASLGRDLPAAQAHVRAAFADGTLQDVDWLPGNTDIGRHQYNDCLILGQAIDQAASPTELTVSPRTLQFIDGRRSLCATLRGAVNGAPWFQPRFYHRYIHGHTMLARFLLPVLPVSGIRTLYHAVLTLLVMAGIVVSMIGLARRRDGTGPLFFLILFLALSRWFGLESYGQSLSHGPSDIVAVGYALMLAIAATGRGIDRRAAILAAAMFGALTAIFEFLTGGIPLGLAMVIGGLPFAARTDADDRPTRFVAEAATAFCAAVLGCLLLKMMLAVAVFGPAAFTDSAAQLGARIGVTAAPGDPVGDLGPVHMAKQLVKGLGGLAAGMSLMAGLMIALALAAGGWGARRLLTVGPAAMQARTLALLVSNLAIMALLGLLWQHTLVHAWFMERTLVWTIASGFALFALAIRERR